MAGIDKLGLPRSVQIVAFSLIAGAGSGWAVSQWNASQYGQIEQRQDEKREKQHLVWEAVIASERKTSDERYVTKADLLRYELAQERWKARLLAEAERRRR